MAKNADMNDNGSYSRQSLLRDDQIPGDIRI
jgi:hypothetical protein